MCADAPCVTHTHIGQADPAGWHRACLRGGGAAGRQRRTQVPDAALRAAQAAVRAHAKPGQVRPARLLLHLTQRCRACLWTCRNRAGLNGGLDLVADMGLVCVLCVLMCSKYNLTELVCMGGFDNTRQEVSWEGFTLELDETKYPWGTLYELEAETVRDAGVVGWRRALVFLIPSEAAGAACFDACMPAQGACVVTQQLVVGCCHPGGMCCCCCCAGPA